MGKKVWAGMLLGMGLLPLAWPKVGLAVGTDRVVNIADELTWEEQVQMECRWCGLSCVKAISTMNCVMLAPPEGKVCVWDKGECVIKSSSEKPSPTPKPKTNKNIPGWGSCNNFWWIDDKSSECKEKEFCGLYMYKGLRLFKTKAECTKALGESKSCGKCDDKPRVRGDANCDGVVSLIDFSWWKAGYLNKTNKGDFNCDTKTSLDDFWIWKGEFIKSKLLKK